MTKKSKRAQAVRVQLERERERARVEKAPAGTPLVAIPHRIGVKYATPAALGILGPVIMAIWSVPPVLADKLAAAGRPVPAPIGGQMLIDTGASATLIALDVAVELRLQPVRIGKSYGAHGLQDCQVFEAHLQIAIGNESGVSSIEIDRQVQGVPDLNELFRQAGARGGDGRDLRLVGLLGRDFLSHATLIYNGTKGTIELILDPSTFKGPQTSSSSPPGVV